MADILTMVVDVLTRIYLFYESLGNTIFEFYVTYSRSILDVMHIFFDNLLSVLLIFTAVLTFSYFMMGIILLFKKKKYVEQPVKNSQLPFVSIQIPTYNELAALNCAKRCLAFDYPKNKYEIIIGDDSSDPLVSKKIDAFSKQHKQVKVTRRGSNKGYKPGNLNYMLPRSKGEYLVIFDSDFLPEKDFLRRIIAPFIHDPSLSAVQARWLTRNFSQNFISVLGGTIPLLTHHLGLPFLNLINGNSFIAGSAEAIKKKDLVDLGGWQTGSLTEDIEYSLRLTGKGMKIQYVEDLLCACEAPFTLRDLFRQQMRWGYGVVSAVKKHFWTINLNRKLTLSNKINMYLLLCGYVITFLFFSLTAVGFFSIITHRPELIDWNRFISETAFNVLVTSFIFTITVTIILAKKTKELPRVIASSFTVGLLMIYVVSVGVVKALFNRPMEWFMLQKTGNVVLE